MLSKVAECLEVTRLEMKARPLVFKVSVLCPLLKFRGNSAQLMYTHKVIIFEVEQTRDSFGMCLLKQKFQAYIAPVGKRNATFEACTMLCKVKNQHEIPRSKGAVLLAAPRSSDVSPISQIGYYRPRPFVYS